MEKERSGFSLGICIPVWNRGKLFSLAFDSLLKQLEGIDATIWLFDNGSDVETRNILHSIAGDASHKVIKVFLPENMGIPYIANVFAKAIRENCDFTGYQTPDFVMIMDSDAYFKKPVIDLIKIIERDYAIGLISGHDSTEHPAIKEMDLTVDGKVIHIKEKENERMISMLMHTDEFLQNYPFPHYRNRDVDWEITQWNPNSMMARKRKIIVACDYVLHLGIHSSTWNTSAKKLESEEEINEVQSILEKAGIRFKVDVIVPPGEFYQRDDEFSAKKNGTDNGIDGNNEMLTSNQPENIEKAVKP
jgi:glycosyltransferase involved in cell wall biosynthesis